MNLFSRFVLWFLRGPRRWLMTMGLYRLSDRLLLSLQDIGAYYAREERQEAAQQARRNHNFWLPCACGEWFGGQEWAASLNGSARPSIPDPKRVGCSTGICPACTAAGVGDRAWAALKEWQ